MARLERTHARLIRVAVLSAGVAVALAMHGVWLYGLVFTAPAAVPSTLVVGAILIAALKHIGLIGAGYAWLRRRLGKSDDPTHGRPG